MNRQWLYILLLCSLVCFGQIALAQQLEPDPRLAQKVTIDCTGVRLHTALERISAETGVTVHSGKSSTDWKVRDVPALVCARDIPLGTLLKAIADTNHLLLSRNRIDDLITYRIWRDLKREKELSAFEETRQAAVVAAANYDWDALSMIKDLPDSAFPTNPDGTASYTQLRAISRMISELGPEVRDRVLSGETIVVGASNLPEHIKVHYMDAMETMKTSVEKNGQDQSDTSGEQLNRCYARIAFDNRRGTTPVQLGIDLYTHIAYTQTDYSDYLDLLKKSIPNFPPRPKVPKQTLESDSLPANYAVLVTMGDDAPKFLDIKFKVEALEEGQQPQYSDLLRMISDATGYSIIAEGSAARFRSAFSVPEQRLRDMFGIEITVRDVLNFPLSVGNSIHWYIDETNKLIIGRDPHWVDALKALVPEKLLVQLNGKLQGDGVYFDDLQPLLGLTEDQIREWITYCPEYPDIKRLEFVAPQFSGDGLWSLYFALDSKARTIARSGVAVPLDGIDRGWLSQVLQRQVSALMYTFYLNGRMILGKIPPDMMSLDAFGNPDGLPELSLHLEKIDYSEKKGPNKHSYMIYVEGIKDASFSLSCQMTTVFPIQPEAGKQPKQAQ